MNKIAHLASRSIIRIGGEDAAGFLHNVVTSNVSGMEMGETRYGGLLTPQGKLLFDFIVVKTKDGFILDCAKSQSAQLAQRLTMYKLRSKVTIEPDGKARVYAAWGEEAPAGKCVYADPRLQALGWRIIGTVEPNATEDDYHRHRIALGIADTDMDLGSGEVFAHEANMDQLGGVSFTKGCYVGQEVVSRMEHRGTARSRFVMVEGAGDLQSDAAVRAGDIPAGVVKSVDGQNGLALLRLDRVAKALREGKPVTADGVAIDVTLAAWARYQMPGEDTEEV